MLFTPLNPELVEKVRLALDQKRYGYFVGRVDVGGGSAGDEARVTFGRYAELFATKPELVKNVRAYFAREDMRDSAPSAHDCFYLEQHQESSYGLEGPRLEVGAFGVRPESFELFVSIVEGVLPTQRVAAHGLTLDDTRLRERFRSRWVDPDLMSHTSGAISARQYDVAVKAAIGVVETRLRAKCVAAGRAGAQALSGMDLAIEAFHKDRGCLVPPWPVATEAQAGAQLMFQGFFLYLRNAFAHHSVVMGNDTTSVYDVLAMCEFLLKVIDKSTVR
jgi:Protein of unknown function (Hypoth_ymh)